MKEPLMADRFVRCRWTCSKCNCEGTVKPWQRSGESADDAATRHTLEARGTCVYGCAYVATPVMAKRRRKAR